MKTTLIIIALFFSIRTTDAQHLEVEGKVKIANMDKITTADSVVTQIRMNLIWLRMVGRIACESEYRRPFLIVTTDGVNCSTGLTLFNDSNTAMGGNQVADDFMMELVNLSSANFGTIGNPNYKFISIVGVSNILSPQDPIELLTCPSAVEPGTGYQALSIITAGN